MLTENAHVIAARGDRAVVRTLRSEACGSCGAQSACNAMGGSKNMEVEVLNPIRAKTGDRVELALPESSFLKASIVTYLIPLTALLGGALAGHHAAGFLHLPDDAATIILAAAGVLAAVPVVAWLNKKLSINEAFIPKIIRVLPRLDDRALQSLDNGHCRS